MSKTHNYKRESMRVCCSCRYAARTADDWLEWSVLRWRSGV